MKLSKTRDVEYFVIIYKDHINSSTLHFFTLVELLEWMDDHKPPQETGSGEGYTIFGATCIIDWS